MGNFCTNCGTPVSGAGRFCKNCGMAVDEPVSFENNTYKHPKSTSQSQVVGYYERFHNERSTKPQMNQSLMRAHSLIKSLTVKIRVEGIIWLIIAIFQVLVAIELLINHISVYNPISKEYEYNTYTIIYMILLLFIAINNFRVSYVSFQNAAEFASYPKGIVDAYGNPYSV